MIHIEYFINMQNITFPLTALSYIQCRCFKEDFYGRSVILADRDAVEQGSDEILKGAANEDVAFLVVGDPFGYMGILVLC